MVRIILSPSEYNSIDYSFNNSASLSLSIFLRGRRQSAETHIFHGRVQTRGNRREKTQTRSPKLISVGTKRAKVFTNTYTISTDSTRIQQADFRTRRALFRRTKSSRFLAHIKFPIESEVITISNGTENASGHETSDTITASHYVSKSGYGDRSRQISNALQS